MQREIIEESIVPSACLNQLEDVNFYAFVYGAMSLTSNMI